MKKATILVVEDNPTTRKMIRVILVSQDYAVLEAASGKEAIAIMQSNQPELILQDMLLPDMDGIELNRCLRALANGEDVPILALTGFLNKFEERQATYTGFTAHLIKPIEPNRLLDVVKSYLPKHKIVQANEATSKNVLIADDDPSQRKLLSLQLKHAGFQVITAENGLDAFEKARIHHPDVIVSDILMPVQDGFELCMNIRQDKALAHIPVILLTSQYLEQSDQELAKKVGANGYVTRTEDSKVLIEMINKSLHASPPLMTAVPDHAFKEEHIHSLIRQLDRQVLANTGLAQRSALQTAQLSLLRGVADALTSSRGSVDIVLHNVLAVALDAAGISKGVLYLKDKQNDLSLHQFIGFTDKDIDNLATFFGYSDILHEVMLTQAILEIPSCEIKNDIASALLHRAQIKAGLIIPLASANECYGVLFLGSSVADIMNADFLIFAYALGKQIGQSIALATTFERLTISEQRYRTLMDKASCGIVICNLEGRIMEVNRQCEILLGCPKDYILGKNYIEFIIPDEKNYINLQLKKIKSEKTIGPNDCYIQQVNGNHRAIEYSIAYVEIGNEALLLAVLTDVTERNRLREQALLKDKLATVGLLAAGVVHEINNPVTWILENLSYLKTNFSNLIKNKQLVNELKKEGRNVYHELNQYYELINETLQGAEQIRDIVRNLKGFARMDDEAALMADIHEILLAAIKIASSEYKYKAKLEKDFAPNLPPLLTQASKLQQVFVNLLVNAAQAFTNDVKEENIISIKTGIEDDWIRIDITDTGQGIAADNLNKVFEPFFTTKAIGVGTGLGLSICQEIVHNLGGEIHVQSVQGEGTVFTIMLPAVQEERSANLAQALKKGHYVSQANILVVDNEPAILKMLQRILSPKHEVTTVTSGREALGILVQKPYAFDIIISDLCMPEINGSDLYRYVAEKQPGLERAIIFITGSLNTTQNKSFIRSINNPVLEKPFTKDEILCMVDMLMAATVAH